MIDETQKPEKVLAVDLSTEGKNPLKDRILGISTKSLLEEKIFANREELVILTQFLGYAKHFDKIVGFNSDEFDVPFLIVRSIKNKLTIPNLKGKLLDIRKIITVNSNYQKGTLTDFQELLEIKFSDSRYKKMHMSLLWEGDFPSVKEFMMRDTKITWELYDYLKEAGLV